jgi:heme oxygenase
MKETRTIQGQKTSPPNLVPPPAEPDLVTRLRDATRSLHSTAERSGVVAAILQRRATRYSYMLYLRNLLPAYEQMEFELERWRAAPGLSAIANQDIYRSTRIKADLGQMAGPGWQEDLAVLPVSQRYAVRIAAAAEIDPMRLIAHAYVRYLGDLNGGQVMQRLLAQSLGLAHFNLTFYDFPGITDLGLFRAAYRQAINAAGDCCADTDAVIKEAKAAFQSNMEISEAVSQVALS